MNLPNRITLIRIVLVPLFLAAVLYRHPLGAWVAAVVFVVAAATDGVDGYLARRTGQVTKLGKFMDPLADKLLISAALIALVELGTLSSWVAILIIGRELAVTGLRAIAAAEGVVIAAARSGKLKTVLQSVAIVLVILESAVPWLWVHWLAEVGMALAVILTVYSGVEYFWRWRASIKES